MLAYGQNKPQKTNANYLHKQKRSQNDLVFLNRGTGSENKCSDAELHFWGTLKLLRLIYEDWESKDDQIIKRDLY